MRIIKEGVLPYKDTSKISLKGICHNCGCELEEDYFENEVITCPDGSYIKLINCPTIGCHRMLNIMNTERRV